METLHKGVRGTADRQADWAGQLRVEKPATPPVILHAWKHKDTHQQITHSKQIQRGGKAEERQTGRQAG